MPLETGIYGRFPVQQPSMIGAAQQGVQLAQLARQNRQQKEEREKQKKISDILRRTMGPEAEALGTGALPPPPGAPGTVTPGAAPALGAAMPDRRAAQERALAEIGQVDPMEAMKYRKAFREEGVAELDARLKHVSTAADLARSATDQASYDRMKQSMQQMGVPTDKLPAQFDPALMNQLAFTSTKQMERVAAEKMRMQERMQRRQLSQKQREQLRKETKKRDIPAPTAHLIAEGKEMPALMQQIRNTIDVNEGLFGPIAGRARGALPWDADPKTIDAQMKTSAQLIGKYMEGGVLRKEDEEKYRKMLPTRTDTPEVARNKAQIVEKMLADKQAQLIQTLGQTGFETTPFEREQRPDVELPGLLTGREREEPGIFGTPEAVADERKRLEDLPDADLDQQLRDAGIDPNTGEPL